MILLLTRVIFNLRNIIVIALFLTPLLIFHSLYPYKCIYYKKQFVVFVLYDGLSHRQLIQRDSIKKSATPIFDEVSIV